jgi:hypothetical protein
VLKTTSFPKNNAKVATTLQTEYNQHLSAACLPGCINCTDNGLYWPKLAG